MADYEASGRDHIQGAALVNFRLSGADKKLLLGQVEMTPKAIEKRERLIQKIRDAIKKDVEDWR